MKKRIIVLALGMTLAFSLSACGKSTDSQADTNEAVEETSEETSEEKAESGEAEVSEEAEIEDEESAQSPEEVVLEYAYDDDLNELISGGASDDDFAQFLVGSDWEVCGYDEGNGIQDIDDATDEVYDKYDYEIIFEDESTVTLENQTGDAYEGTYSVKDSQVTLAFDDKSAVISVADGVASMDFDGVKFTLVRFSDYVPAVQVD